MNNKLEVREIEKYEANGKGVFAKKSMKKDELLAVFGGYVMDVSEEENLPNFMNDYGLQINEDLILGIKKEEEISDTDFFNHSCDPNSGFHGQICLVAIRDIIEEEEVTFDYGMVLYHSDSVAPYALQCHCGSRICRKHVTDHDWELTFLQERYRGYFQDFIQRKIDFLEKAKRPTSL